MRMNAYIAEPWAWESGSHQARARGFLSGARGSFDLSVPRFLELHTISISSPRILHEILLLWIVATYKKPRPWGPRSLLKWREFQRKGN
jgi:hypothetical protein